jgi:hypothetical protein
MKKIILLVISLASLSPVFAQNNELHAYKSLTRKGDSLYLAKDYKTSALTFSSAFQRYHNLATARDRYDAACSWSLANCPDSAFSNLQLIASNGSYTSYDHIIVDADLNSLHADKRWAPLLIIIQKNKDKAEANYNKPLTRELDSIYDDDQSGRQQIMATENKYGDDSKEMKILWDAMGKSDSINLIKVKAVLDKYGWVGPDVVGSKGNSTLFLVIQHADSLTRDQYLPMMRAAVKKGKAQPSQLALMEDRSALEHGKKQIYGSQLARDEKTNKYYFRPIEDEANVDKRRAAVGLGSLEDYAKQWGIDYKLPSQ